MKPARSLLGLGSALTLAACADHATTAPVRDSMHPARRGAATAAAVLPGRVIVRFANRSEFSAPESDGALGRVRRTVDGVGGVLERPLRLKRAYVIKVPIGQEEELAARLAEEPDVESAEADYLTPLVPCETGECADPVDGFFGRKWDLHNTGEILDRASNPVPVATTGKVDADIDWLEAFDVLGKDFAGSAIIGILDSGIRSSHLDLAGKVVAARNFAVGYPATLVEDRDSHGTHVAGIAAASGANAVSGVAYGANVKLINAKICERYLFPDGRVATACPSSSTAEAIVWATDQGAQVLNLSIGGSPQATSGSPLQKAAFEYARSKGVLSFCAAGNNNFGNVSFPARFPECVAVGATNWSDTKASYSNFGADVELAAPGGDIGVGSPASFILSTGTSNDGSYSYKAGTSMASPQAAGLAGLLFAAGLPTAEEVLDRMKETADDLGSEGRDDQFGAGRINACRALDPANVELKMPGAFNPKSKGTFTIVLLSSPGFDAEKLGVADVVIGDGRGAEARVEIKHDEYRAQLLDSDGDGDLDLQIKVDRKALAAALDSGDDLIVVRGTIGCRRVAGSAEIRVKG